MVPGSDVFQSLLEISGWGSKFLLDNWINTGKRKKLKLLFNLKEVIENLWNYYLTFHNLNSKINFPLRSPQILKKLTKLS